MTVTAHRRAWLRETAPGYLLSRGDTLLVFGGLMLGLLLSALNQTIVATALPSIVEDLGGLQQYSWVFSAYMLLSTVTVPVFGRLSDIHGRRPYFVLGLVLFMAGGVVGATASSMEQIIAARGIQGLAAGALIPLSYAAIGDLVPASDRGRWQGVIGAVFAFASIVGPLTGGWITDHAHWRWVFLVSLPVGALALVVVLARLRTRPHPERAQRVDVPGALLLTGSMSALLYGVVELGVRGELWDVHVSGAFAAGIALTVALVRQQRRATEPFVPAELLGDRTSRLAAVSSFAAGAAFFVCVMFVPLYAQGVLGAPATEAGLVLMPFMLVVFLTSIWSGHRIARTGRYRWAVVSGPPATAAGFALLALLDEGSSLLAVGLASSVVAFGCGLILWNLVLVIQNAAPTRHLGSATSLAQFTRSTGGTIAVAVMGAVLAAGVAGEARAGDVGPAKLADAIHPVFLAAVPMMLLASWVALRIPELPLRRSVREEEEPVALHADP